MEEIKSGAELAVTFEDVKREVILERDDIVTKVLRSLDFYTEE